MYIQEKKSLFSCEVLANANLEYLGKQVGVDLSLSAGSLL